MVDKNDILIIFQKVGAIMEKLNEKSTHKSIINKISLHKQKIILVGTGLVIFCIICLNLVYTTVMFGDKRIRLFAPERLEQFVAIIGIEPRSNSFQGEVLDDYILQTNLGEITLRRSAKIQAGLLFTDSRVLGIHGIEAETFNTGLVSHNLVFEGNELPKNISISFDWDRIRSIDLNNEITISGIPLAVRFIEIPVSFNRLIHRDAKRTDTFISVENIPETIILADLTVIHTNGRSMTLYKGNERWMLAISSLSTLYVTRPGELEAAKYATVEFGTDWGNYIGGMTYEEMEAFRAENRRRTQAGLDRIRFGR